MNRARVNYTPVTIQVPTGAKQASRGLGRGSKYRIVLLGLNCWHERQDLAQYICAVAPAICIHNTQWPSCMRHKGNKQANIRM